jgi:glycosyltransferase involved in cell wall biosynthesis
MKISIIVPAFNEEKNICSCLKSLINQDFDQNEYEVILVNNNSTDRTKEIALNYKGIKVVDEPNQGYVHALIRGCKEAQGEIFLFTDTDSLVPQDWVSKYWQAYLDKNVVVAGGPGKFRPIIWQTFFLEPILYIGGVMFKLSNGLNFSIRKKTYLECHGFSPKVNFNADAYLQLKARKLGKSLFLRNNPVITSSRRFCKLNSLVYIAKSITNLFCLALFRKTLFYEFGNCRD